MEGETVIIQQCSISTQFSKLLMGGFNNQLFYSHCRFKLSTFNSVDETMAQW